MIEEASAYFGEGSYVTKRLMLFTILILYCYELTCHFRFHIKYKDWIVLVIVGKSLSFWCLAEQLVIYFWVSLLLSLYRQGFFV